MARLSFIGDFLVHLSVSRFDKSMHKQVRAHTMEQVTTLKCACEGAIGLQHKQTSLKSCYCLVSTALW